MTGTGQLGRKINRKGVLIGYHPGGEMTRRMARALGLRRGERVLDVACGRGSTALLLADEFAAYVDGIDPGWPSIERARAESIRRDLDGLTRFQVGDAEQLPFSDASFDVVVCECAFRTFPDKQQAATEFARVLRPGGRLGLSDVTIDPARLNPDLAALARSIAGLANAQTAAEYAAQLAAVGLVIIASEAHDDALARMDNQIEDVVAGTAGYCLIVAARL